MAIRPDNDPNGAPKGELEQYGVWVKAEPQDVIEDVAIPGPPLSEALSEESFLSEDEEKLLGSFDSEFRSPFRLLGR